MDWLNKWRRGVGNGNGAITNTDISGLLTRLADRLDVLENASRPVAGASWSFMQSCVGIGAILGFFANQGMWFYIAIYVPEAKEISPGILAILNQGSGSIMTFAGIVIGYYFGSSKGSQDKEDTAKQVAQTTAKAVETAAAGTAALQATVNKVMSSTGNGGANGKTVVMNQPDVTANQPIIHNQDVPITRDQLIAAATAKFVSGEYDEATFRAMLKAKEIGLSDADIDAAVLANKKG